MQNRTKSIKSQTAATAQHSTEYAPRVCFPCAQETHSLGVGVTTVLSAEEFAKLESDAARRGLSVFQYATSEILSATYDVDLTPDDYEALARDAERKEKQAAPVQLTIHLCPSKARAVKKLAKTKGWLETDALRGVLGFKATPA